MITWLRLLRSLHLKLSKNIEWTLYAYDGVHQSASRQVLKRRHCSGGVCGASALSAASASLSASVSSTEWHRKLLRALGAASWWFRKKPKSLGNTSQKRFVEENAWPVWPGFGSLASVARSFKPASFCSFAPPHQRLRSCQRRQRRR